MMNHAHINPSSRLFSDDLPSRTLTLSAARAAMAIHIEIVAAIYRDPELYAEVIGSFVGIDALAKGSRDDLLERAVQIVNDRRGAR